MPIATSIFFTLADETAQKRRYFRTGIRVDYLMPAFYFLLNSGSRLKILGLIDEIYKNFDAI